MNDARTELQIKIKEYVHALEDYLETKLDPWPYTTCGQVWEAEGRKKARESELWSFIETLTVYKKG
ncbi:MAG: hypothetical protein IKC23_05120 [Fibrobacter sp.]|nr:hypothetical protein [Fibrobacter sp.]